MRWSSTALRTSAQRSSRSRCSTTAAAIDARDIQQIVDQARELRRLALDDLLRAARVLSVLRRVVEDVEAGADGRERVAELVRQHRHELVLAPVGLLEPGVGRLQRLHGQLPLGDVADDEEN